MKNGIGRLRQSRTARQLLAGAVLAAMLAGCQMASKTPLHTGSLGDSGVVTSSDLGPEEARAAVQKWGAAYSKDEKNKIAALNYAAALRAAELTGQAVAVMRKSAIYHPEDRQVLAAYGKALAADGQFPQALETVRRAQRPDNPDWQLLSTEGGILDSLQKHEEARALYKQALVLAPDEPQILNNLGLSYVLTNELENAEEILRKAAASPKATLKIRKNLALVLRLRGKNEEANLIAGTPASRAEEPVDQENTWAELTQDG